MHNKINIILGATASGKTNYGIKLAHNLNGEIINSDSQQVYQEIPILTAQPIVEERENIHHHLFGMISCFESFNVKNWLDLTIPCIKEIQARGKTPIIVGGTGLYVKVLLEGLSDIPDLSNEFRNKFHIEYSTKPTNVIFNELIILSPESSILIKPNDRTRILRALEVFKGTGKSLIEWQSHKTEVAFGRDKFNLILIERTRTQIYDRINQRFLKMLDAGALEEVRNLLDKGNINKLPKANGIFEIIDYYYGNLTLNDVIKRTQQSSRNYAKRQMTWFRHQLIFDQIISL